MNISEFLILESRSLRDALKKISLNKHGFILITNSDLGVQGLATDGDIRQKLIEGISLDDPIRSCANTNFLWASANASREALIKKLDHQIKFIPILDENSKLIDLVSKDDLPILAEGPVFARARSPVRISFSGGGSDLTHYFSIDDGAVLNATISLYSHATMRLRDDTNIIIKSRDLKDEFYAEDLMSALKLKSNFTLIQSLIKTVRPDFGFDLYLHSDFPIKSGLGGSSAISAAVLGCFNQFRRDQWDCHEIAELAYQAERLYHGVAGGWQDQYATVFGGINFMEFSMDQNIVHPLRIPPNILAELEESLLLCDTGVTHDSGNVHKDQKQEMERTDIRRLVKFNVELTYRIRDNLLRGRLLEFGQSLNEAWQFKRQFSKKISNTRLDKIYEGAIKNGAIGGKLLGAGGGGFFIFYIPPFRKIEFMDYILNIGLKIQPFRFESSGLNSWTSREHDDPIADRRQ